MAKSWTSYWSTSWLRVISQMATILPELFSGAKHLKALAADLKKQGYEGEVTYDEEHSLHKLQIRAGHATLS